MPCAQALLAKGSTISCLVGWHAFPSCCLFWESSPAHLCLRPLPLLAHSSDTNCFLPPPVPTLPSLCSTCCFLTHAWVPTSCGLHHHGYAGQWNEGAPVSVASCPLTPPLPIPVLVLPNLPASVEGHQAIHRMRQLT